MQVENNDLRAALWQQLETDRLFGLTSVPLPQRAAAPGAPGESRRAGRLRGHSAFQTTAPRRPPAPLRDPASAEQRLRQLNDSQVKNCRKCALCETRTQTVFGQGHAQPRLVFVGEAPGYDEDKQGLAFVGLAGQLLTKMIAAMGLTRDEVFICNVLKCRPPNNRPPNPDEILACHPYLREQLEILNPELIVALGAPAAKTLLSTAESIGRLRGRWHDCFLSGVTGDGPAIPCMPTYHPSYLLRTPEEKAKTWSDLQMVMARMELPMPQR